MSRPWQSWWPVVALAGIAGLALVRGDGRSIEAQAAAGAAGWEYQTASVELASLSNKLTEFGRDGWEVFSILNTDATVDTGADGKPHVINLRVEVTAKRQKAS